LGAVEELAIMIDDDSQATNLARECVYRFLASVLSDPLSGRWDICLSPENQRLAQDAADLLRDEACGQAVRMGFGELPLSCLDMRPLLRELVRPIDELREQYERVFGLVHARECPPYETEYHQTIEPFFRAQQLADVAGFYRAFGLRESCANPDRPDHVALELEFMAFLVMKGRLAYRGDEPDSGQHEAVCADAERQLFRDHLAWWLPSFVSGLRRKADGGMFGAAAQVLAAFLPVERARFQIAPARLALQPTLIERPDEQAGCLSCGSA
jgi:TorA maturation chaperone TorD